LNHAICSARWELQLHGLFRLPLQMVVHQNLLFRYQAVSLAARHPARGQLF